MNMILWTGTHLGILLRQLHQLPVVGVRLASPGGHVDDAEDAASVGVQPHRGPVDGVDGELVDGVRHGAGAEDAAVLLLGPHWCLVSDSAG